MCSLFAQNIHYFCGILEHSYGIRQKHGYLIQWLIGMGDLVVLNLLFFAVYYGLGNFIQKLYLIVLREVVLLLNFCYFFALYFVPMQLHVAVVFIDKIVQRAFALVSIYLFSVRYLSYLSEYRGCPGYISAGLFCCNSYNFCSLRVFVRVTLKDVP